MSINVVILSGYVGRDPEVKYFESGSVKCTFSLAVKRFKGKDKETNWFDLEIWGKPAQTAADYIRKGSLIGIKGMLKFDSWSDRTTGQPRTRPIILVDRWEFIGGKKDADSSVGGSRSNDFDEF